MILVLVCSFTLQVHPLGGEHLHAGSKDQARPWTYLEDHPLPFLLLQSSGASPRGDHLHAGGKDEARSMDSSRQ